MTSQGDVQRRLETAASLGNLVTTMKGLASVRVHQYRRTMQALDASTLTLERAARALLHLHPELADLRPGPDAGATTVVFGSDRGLCGAFNDRMARFAARDTATAGDTVRIVAIGRRVARRMRSAGRAPGAVLPAPSSLDSVDAAVAALLDLIDTDRDVGHGGPLRLLHARPVGSTRFEARAVQVLPISGAWMRDARARPWESRKWPMELSDPMQLLRALIRQRMALAFVKAFGSSLAAENAARLAAMEAASRNVEERLARLRAQHRAARQAQITAELLDIQSAADALDMPIE